MNRIITATRLANLVAALLVLALYVVSLWSMPLHVFWSPDEGGKFFALASIEWNGQLRYSPPYTGRRIDPELRFYSSAANRSVTFPYPVFEAQNRVRFHWPIWFALVSRVFFEAFGVGGIYIVPLVSGWLVALISGWIASRFEPRLGAPAILVVGLATPVWFYSLTFWEHTLVALLAMLVVALASGSRSGSPVALATMLALLAAAALLRPETIVFAVALLGAWGWAGWRAGRPSRARGHDEGASVRTPTPSWRRWLAIAVVAVLLVVTVSSLFTERHRRRIASVSALISNTLRHGSELPHNVTKLLVDSPFGEGPRIAPGWSASATAAVLVCFLAPFLPLRLERFVLLPALAFVLWYSIGLMRLDQPYRSLHGLFAIAPYLALWVYALRSAWQGTTSQGVLAATAGFYLIAGGLATIVWHSDASGRFLSGLEWGQRYLLPLYPMLAILVLVALREYGRSARTRGLKTVVLALAVAMISVAVQLQVRGTAMLRANRATFAAWQQALPTDEPLITDLWWLPATLAPMFVSSDTFFVRRRAELADWVTLGRRGGVTAFTFVSNSPIDAGDLAAAGLRPIPDSSRTLQGLHIARFALP